MESPLSFENIPLELQLYILGLLSPFDLLACRQVSRAFYDLSCQRSLWIEATTRVHEESSAFMPSFEFDKMSLPDLEHSAITPYRWLRLTDQKVSIQATKPSVDSDPTPLVPTFTRRLHRPEDLKFPRGAKPHSDYLGSFKNLYLVPGGRYLITVAWNWTGLWDLGVGATVKESENLQPVAILSAEYSGMVLVHPTPDNSGLRIFLKHFQEDDDSSSDEDEDEDVVGGRSQNAQTRRAGPTSIFEVYEIYPQSAEPQFKMLGSLSVLNIDRIIVYSVSADRLIFLQHDVLKLWEFTTGAWTAIAIDPDFVQIIVSDTTIVLVSDTGVAIYPIPTKLQTSQPPFTTIFATKPSFVLPYAWRNGRPMNGWCHGPCDWYSGSKQRLLFEFDDGVEEPAIAAAVTIASLVAQSVIPATVPTVPVSGSSGSDVQLQSTDANATNATGTSSANPATRPAAALRRIEAIVAPDFSTAQVVELAILPAPDIQDRFYEASRFCAGAIVESYTMNGDDEIIVQTFSTPDIDVDLAKTLTKAPSSMNTLPPRDDSGKPKFSLLRIHDADRLISSFCPLSARMVYVENSRDIIILDYFSKPEQAKGFVHPLSTSALQISKDSKLEIIPRIVSIYSGDGDDSDEGDIADYDSNLDDED